MIEVVVTIAIMSVIAVLAIPSYVGFLQRGKLANGTEALVSLRGLMEQAYQANRSYQNAAGACAIAGFADDHFTYSCTSSSTRTYNWTSTSHSGTGLGAAGDYVYSLNQDGDAFTLKFAGGTLADYRGWKLR